MVGSRRRRPLQRQRQRHRAPAAATARLDLPLEQPMPEYDVRVSFVNRLPPELLPEIHRRLAFVDLLPQELLPEIHRRLAFVDRLNFALNRGASGSLITEAPCLILPGDGEDETEEKLTIFSIADSRAATLHAPDLAVHGHVVLGSSDGWLVTADARAALRIANPLTGAQLELPAITTSTIPFLRGGGFCLDGDAFVQLRFGGPPPTDDKIWGPIPPRTFTLTAEQMRHCFYRKVVLSVTSAMLILERTFGVPAFMTSTDFHWRMAPSRDGIEDAIHHNGRFHSITYSGMVEAWGSDRDTGEFTSTVVAPRLAVEDDSEKHHRKYLAAAADGRLMVVLKFLKVVNDKHGSYWRSSSAAPVFFKVQVLNQARRRWEEAASIGYAALFVGMNATLCVSTREHPGIKAGCVYFTDDELGVASLRNEKHGTYHYYGEDRGEVRHLGVYSLRDGKMESIEGLGKHRCWAWFTPTVS